MTDAFSVGFADDGRGVAVVAVGFGLDDAVGPVLGVTVGLGEEVGEFVGSGVALGLGLAVGSAVCDASDPVSGAAL